VNLLNHMPETGYRHAIVCLRDSTEFRRRLKDSIPVFELGKREGQDFRTYRRLYRLLRQLRPTIVHTRTWATLDCQYYAFLAGIPCRVHGEHSQHTEKESLLHWIMRKGAQRLIQEYIAVNEDLTTWLVSDAKVERKRVSTLYNGVDTKRFAPAAKKRSGEFVIGYVGRMEPVKDPLNLVSAFIRLIHDVPAYRNRVRLMFVGDGSLRHRISDVLGSAGLSGIVEFAGERNDIEALYGEMDLLVVPSRSEGTCNAILEAMASGLPVVATRVGGNAELVEDEKTGMLVPISDPAALARAIRTYIEGVACKSHGGAARLRAEERFSMDRMVQGYLSVYDRVLCGHVPNVLTGRNSKIAESVS